MGSERSLMYAIAHMPLFLISSFSPDSCIISTSTLLTLRKGKKESSHIGTSQRGQHYNTYNTRLKEQGADSKKMTVFIDFMIGRESF